MAAVEDLIKQIADTRLRDQLTAEIVKLKASKQFGLVFEEHMPELVRLPGLPVRTGVRVVKKDDRTSPLYRVIAEMNGKKVRVAPDAGGPEEVVERAALVVIKAFGEPMYPSLVQVDAIERGPGRQWHTLINADNYHALQLLLYGYEGMVDAIYIDPPYNSGARDWKYNNDYVDRTDLYRHSKWLSMMKRRLVLAKRLLKLDGVLICTVDENEVGHLSVLLEMIFPEYLRHMVSVVINPKGTGKLNFARVDEYAFFCVPNNGTSIIRGIPSAAAKATAPGEGALFYPNGPATPLFPIQEDETTAEDEDEVEAADDEDDENGHVDDIESESLPFPPEELPEWELRHARRRGSESSYRHQRKNQFYPIYIDEKARRVVRAGASLPLEAKPNFAKVSGLAPVWPIDKEGNERCWRFIAPRMQDLIDAGRVRLGKYNVEHKSWTLNIWERRPESKKLKTVWWKKAHDAGTHGTTLLHNILGRRGAFPFPKSIYAVADALAAVVRTRPEAVILDFFAGSGTTLHATCMLNAVYGGSRRCIMVTNNEVDEKTAAKLSKKGIEPGSPKYEEHGIAEATTWPRTKSILTGQRPDGRKLAGNYLDGRPMADGFEENAVYFKLDFLDPADISRGEKFEAITPILWMLAGCHGAVELSRGSSKWFIPKGNSFAVLLREDHFQEFLPKLDERPDARTVFLVTDSPEAFHDMAEKVGKKRPCIQLYRSYLDTFRINLEQPRAL